MIWSFKNNNELDLLLLHIKIRNILRSLLVSFLSNYAIITTRTINCQKHEGVYH